MKIFMPFFSPYIALKAFAISFAIIALSACEGKKDDEQKEQDEERELTSDVKEEGNEESHAASGHGQGDAGHAPREAVFSENRVFLASVIWSDNLRAGTLENSAQITFWEPQLHKTAAVLKSFKLFMPAMGHGSIKTDQLVLTQDPANPAVWQASRIYFSMPGGPGEWVVDIEAEVGGRRDKVRVTIPQAVNE